MPSSLHGSHETPKGLLAPSLARRRAAVSRGERDYDLLHWHDGRPSLALDTGWVRQGPQTLRWHGVVAHTPNTQPSHGLLRRAAHMPNHNRGQRPRALSSCAYELSAPNGEKLGPRPANCAAFTVRCLVGGGWVNVASSLSLRDGALATAASTPRSAGTPSSSWSVHIAHATGS